MKVFSHTLTPVNFNTILLNLGEQYSSRKTNNKVEINTITTS
jgi:hypothetical protein